VIQLIGLMVGIYTCVRFVDMMLLREQHVVVKVLAVLGFAVTLLLLLALLFTGVPPTGTGI
jgi:UPF0716 family protein affecting phage T7 exclusion